MGKYFSFKIINIETRIWDYMQHETKIGMVSQAILIGIVIGVFFAGIGIGYAVLQSNTTPTMMTPQQMQQMMSNPEQMSKWQQTMMNNPQAMNQWMNTMMQDPQAMQQMHNMMTNDPQHMNQMMGPMMDSMMNEPQMRQHMVTMMMQNPTMMNSMMSDMPMMNMLNNQTIGTNMNTQNPSHAQEVIDQMKQNHQFTQDMITAMLNDPDLRLQIIGHMTENQEAMQQMQMMLNDTGSMNGPMMGNPMNP